LSSIFSKNKLITRIGEGVGLEIDKIQAEQKNQVDERMISA